MPHWITQAHALDQNGTPYVLVTVTQVTGSGPREVGAKMLVTHPHGFFGSIGGGNLEHLALEEARKFFGTPNLEAKTLRFPLGAKAGQCCGGTVDLLFEPMNLGPTLLLFGAGHVAQAICRVLAGTPFQVHLIDEREEWVMAKDLPDSIHRHLDDPLAFAADYPFDSHLTFIAVLTHRHDLDQALIETLLRKPYRTLGLIGSHSKWARFKSRLLLKGFTEEELSKVNCPFGLPIGGKSPAECAISLSAQFLQIYHQRQQATLPTRAPL